MSAIRLLLVEDHTEHQRLLCNALTRSQPTVEIQVVKTGHDLVDILAQQHFDCILLDFNLPDSRADALLPALTHDAHCPPVIVLSSSQDQNTVIRSMRSGSVDFVPKAEALRGNTLWQRIELALSNQRKATREHRLAMRRIRRLTELAETDPLTGLSNRLYLEHMMHDERIMYDRRGYICCIMGDLDHFKIINDTWGHIFGDHVLRAVADVLRSCANPEDTICRMGGEEFLVARQSVTVGEAILWTEHVREQIRRINLERDGQPVNISISMGFAASVDGHLGKGLIQQADEALYLAKGKGRDRTCWWDMVLFEKLARQSRSTGTKPPLVRLREVFSELMPRLGPTQREHVTSHSRQVSLTAFRLGRIMGMDEACLERLRVAGMCHDIGKLVIPEDILGKSSPLSAQERFLLARHSEYGADMCLQLGLDQETVDYIRYHHFYFGGGAGHGSLHGCDIPLGARILCVVDALVVITSSRSYSLARSVRAALSELRCQRGRQFDPDVVDAAEQLLTHHPALEDAR